jgi:formate hydrogenlyase subunit 4
MIMGYSGYYLKIFKGTNTINYYPLFWLFATLLLTIAAYLLVDINFYFKCIITLVLLIGSVIGIIRFKHLIN